MLGARCYPQYFFLAFIDFSNLLKNSGIIFAR